ncbi:mannitol dehydrogenase family protein [Piscinibacter defluvii]|uniref:mannitol dehydrogenase family protein n=1 Tax=Piscinibacter defluvii TaxID=1796922 RepID=UPI000FDD6E46|nr:mannitol dehydrogenase family protein [Piscinibacter defluvii]
MTGGPPILQFGTGRFLQAHVDLFVHEALQAGEALGGICVVQGTGSPVSSARTAALARAEGYEVIVRGLVDGQPHESRRRCTAVHEAVEARTHWPALRQRMREQVQVIVSNTGDTGWALHPGDGPSHWQAEAAAPEAFAARLLVLLHDRWLAAPERPLSLLPCELVSRNGERLRALLLQLAREWGGEPAFLDWLGAHPVWANSLVDRIVSEPLEPVGAVAEPYALWAVERQPRLVLPCRHPAIVLTDDLAPYERLKLFLLNLGHTVLAELWLRGAHARELCVRDAMHDAAMRTALEAVWQEEVLPVFDALGEGAAAREYLVVLRDRLLNPYLAHRLADIAQNHAQKKQRRIAPLLVLAAEACPALAQPRLNALLA